MTTKTAREYYAGECPLCGNDVVASTVPGTRWTQYECVGCAHFLAPEAVVR